MDALPSLISLLINLHNKHMEQYWLDGERILSQHKTMKFGGPASMKRAFAELQPVGPQVNQRKHTGWETAVPIVLCHLQCAEVDGAALENYVCEVKQGGPLASSQLSADLSRLDQEGFACKLIEMLPAEDQPQREGDEKEKDAPKGPSLDARALALFIEDRSRKIKDIAKLLGKKNTQGLSPQRCPKLHAAMRAWKAPDRRVRGTKDGQGNLEAYLDEA